MSIEYKTQTNRSTNFKKCTNISVWIGQGINLAVCTSKYWGVFEEYRQDPLIEVEIDGQNHSLKLSEFKESLKAVLNDY